jgi:3-isopropylmalate dehydrogenase
MFEPVHGSAPPLAGKDLANPFAALLTAGMLLAHLGWPEEERRIEAAVSAAIDAGQCTRDVGGTLGTRAASAWVRERVAQSFAGWPPVSARPAGPSASCRPACAARGCRRAT